MKMLADGTFSFQIRQDIIANFLLVQISLRKALMGKKDLLYLLLIRDPLT
ncbi:hypothetical protein FXW07_04865 [Methanosarcina sp. DH1]|nr:hypothetical protein [Methanosarcina sp. DH1]